MIIRKHLDPRVIWKFSRRRILLLTVFSTSVVVHYRQLDAEDLAISTLPASVLGVVLAFLIGFRLNSAYEHWWEARKIWGALVNDSRSFARQVLAHTGTRWNATLSKERVEGLHSELIRGQIGLLYALKNMSRKTDVMIELTHFFMPHGLEQLATKRYIPNAIIQMQSDNIRLSFEEGHTEDFRHMQLDNMLNRITDSMRASERI